MEAVMEKTKVMEKETLENSAVKVETKTCGKRTEVYSRIVGYFRPVSNWNEGKKQEFKDRKTYDVSL